MRRAFLALPALLVLGGCADMMRTMTNEYPSTVPTARMNLQDAAASGPVFLEVRDSPFAGDVAGLMAEAASATSIGIPVRFTARPTEVGRPDYRLVVQFSPGPSDAAELCGRPPAPHAPDANNVSALVAFCKLQQPILSMAAVAPRPSGSEVPIIRTLAEQAMMRMFSNSTSLHESPSDYWPD